MRCPWCKNLKTLVLLGNLGNTKHYRCRACGGLSSKERKKR